MPETLRRCWACGALAHMMLQGSMHSFGPFNEEAPGARVAGLFLCAGCRAPALGLFYAEDADVYLDVKRAEQLATGSTSCDFVSIRSAWYPSKGFGKDYDEAVPTDVAATASEAHMCHSIGAYRASIALSRAAVEAAAKTEGFEQKSFDKQIRAMADSGRILKVVTDGAEEIRLAGNSAMHDVLTVPQTREQSGLFLEVMDIVLDGLFAAGGRIARARSHNAEAKRQREDR